MLYRFQNKSSKKEIEIPKRKKIPPSQYKYESHHYLNLPIILKIQKKNRKWGMDLFVKDA